MFFMALATDYDGTAAFGGRLAPATAEALRRLKASGRRTFLVTGRALDELKGLCRELDLFDRVVAENGAVLYRPASGETETLAEPPPGRLVALLRAKHVAPLSVGRSILATREPHQATVLEAIRTLGLGLEIVFNKGAVMVLPSGVNKASGLAAALAECGLSPLNVVAVGDAENDHAFIKACGCAVAVANAIPSLKAEADLTTAGDHGAGLAELIDRLTEGDLADLPLRRHAVALCETADGPVPADPRGVYMLAGTSGSGKSTLAGGLLERLLHAGYQFCVVDPEGDYEHVEGALVIGEPRTPPGTARVLEALERPDRSVVVNLLGLPHEDRPGFFAALLPELLKLRARSARPHWLVIDEAHHLLPPERPGGAGALPSGFGGLLLITVHPESVARPVLAAVDTLIVAGRDPRRTTDAFAATVAERAPPVAAEALPSGEMLLWRRGAPEARRVRVLPARGERRRHVRKYADGSLGDERSFYFRGPRGRLQLKAQNLTIFLQMAEGVDDETWLHHLRAGDYSAWFRAAIKDEELAAEAAAIEADRGLDASESRAMIAEAVLRRYTEPAEGGPAPRPIARPPHTPRSRQ